MGRLRVNTNGATPPADTATGAAGTVTGTERSKLQGILDGASRLATGALDGLMTAAHYALLAGATSASSSDTLVKRDASGNVGFNGVSAASFGGFLSPTPTPTTANSIPVRDGAAKIAATGFVGPLTGNADTATALAAGNWYQSASTTIAQNSSHTFTHGLGAIPRLWSLRWGPAGNETSAQSDTVRVTQVTSTTITVTSYGQAGSVNVIVSALK